MADSKFLHEDATWQEVPGGSGELLKATKLILHADIIVTTGDFLTFQIGPTPDAGTIILPVMATAELVFNSGAFSSVDTLHLQYTDEDGPEISSSPPDVLTFQQTEDAIDYFVLSSYKGFGFGVSGFSQTWVLKSVVEAQPVMVTTAADAWSGGDSDVLVTMWYVVIG